MDHPVTIDTVMYCPVFCWPGPVDYPQGSFLTEYKPLAIFIYEYINQGLIGLQDF
jgi:hypothetical protein